MKSMKTRFLTILFTILLMVTTWSQTKTFGTKVKIKNMPEVTTIDTLVTATPTGVLSSVKYTSFFSKLLADLQANGSLVGGSAINSIGDVNDVTLTNPSGNQALMYNGSAWVNSAISIPSTQISDFNTAVQALSAPIPPNSESIWGGSTWILFNSKLNNTLTSSSVNEALTANMGRSLKNEIDNNSQHFMNIANSLQNSISNKLDKPTIPNDGNLYSLKFNGTNQYFVNVADSFIQSPAFVQTTVTTISLVNKGGTIYTAGNTATTYSVQNTNVFGGIAYVIIDSSSMTEYPVVTGATLIESPDFVAGTHRMTVFNEAGTIKYFFTKE